MMKRRGIRLLKYLTFAALFLTLGPVTVKLMFGDYHPQQSNGGHRRLKREPIVDHGLPVDPDDMQAAIKYSPVCQSLCLSVCVFHSVYLSQSF